MPTGHISLISYRYNGVTYHIKTEQFVMVSLEAGGEAMSIAYKGNRKKRIKNNTLGWTISEFTSLALEGQKNTLLATCHFAEVKPKIVCKAW